MLGFIFITDGDEVLSSLHKINIWYLLLAFGCMILYWAFESLALHTVIKPIHKAQRFRVSLLISLIGQYYNCVTPFNVGGQPFQAVYLSRYKVPLGSATTALLSKFIVYQFTLTVYCAILLIARLHYFQAELGALTMLTIVGFVVNFTVIMMLVILAFFKNLGFGIIRFFLKFFAKIKLVKNYEQKLSHVAEQADIYEKNFSYLVRQPLLFLKVLVYTVLQLTVFFSISFVIYLGFGFSGVDYLTILSCQSYVLMISSFFPAPGALGAAEGSYSAFFGRIFGTYTAFSMLIWRFLTFYVPLALGFFITLYVDKKSPLMPKEPEPEN